MDNDNNDGNAVLADEDDLFDDEEYMHRCFAESMRFSWQMVLVTAAQSYVERRLSDGISPQIIGRDEVGMLESFQQLLALNDRVYDDVRSMMDPSAPPESARAVAERRWSLADVRRGSFDRYVGAVRDCLHHDGTTTGATEDRTRAR